MRYTDRSDHSERKHTLLTRRTPWWLAAAVLLAGAGTLPTAHAQTPPPSLPGIADPHVTPAELARMKARAAKFSAARDAVVANPKLSDAQKRAKIDLLAKSANADTLAIMTPAQRKIVAANRVIVGQAMASQNARNQAFVQMHATEISAGQALAAKLNASLTPAEKAQIAQINAAAKAQYDQINTDTKLSPQDKQQKLQALNPDTQAKILAVLTPAQKAQADKLQQMRQQLQKEAQAAAPPPAR